MGFHIKFQYVVSMALLLAMPPAMSHGLQRSVFQQPDDFLQEAFAGHVPDSRIIWMIGDMAKKYEEITGHSSPRIRVPYWRDGQRSIWILEEHIADAPAKLGIIIRDNKIQAIHVLAYHSRHGRDVITPWFLDQFNGVSLKGPEQKLDTEIKDISGIGEPVQAMADLARAALYLNEESRLKHATLD